MCRKARAGARRGSRRSPQRSPRKAAASSPSSAPGEAEPVPFFCRGPAKPFGGRTGFSGGLVLPFACWSCGWLYSGESGGVSTEESAFGELGWLFNCVIRLVNMICCVPRWMGKRALAGVVTVATLVNGSGLVFQAAKLVPVFLLMLSEK